MATKKAIKPATALPYPEYNHPDHVKQRAEILACARRDAVWRCEGFATMVLKQGFGAAGPPDRRGKPRSWQMIGVSLFGKEMFETELRKQIAARRSARRDSASERSSDSSSSPPSSPSWADSLPLQASSSS